MTVTLHVRVIALTLLVCTGVAGLAVAPACGPGFLSGIGGRAVDAATPDAAPCYEPTPDRPPIPDAPTNLNLLLAIEDLRVDTLDRDAGIPAPPGRDLDHVCTCPDPPSCKPPTAASPSICDGPRGRDDGFALLFNQIVGLYPQLDFGQYIRGGGYTALIDVQGWNGEPDDSEVVVAIRMSQGLESDIDGGTTRAKFDGTDVWTVDPTSLANGAEYVGMSCESNLQVPCLPLYRDAHAYVRDGQLIARIEFPFTVSSPQGQLTFDLKDVTMVATLGKSSSGAYRLAGQIVGRVPTAPFLSNVGVLRDPQGGHSLCGGGLYPQLKAQVCGAADVMTSPSADGAGAPCDAMSAAIGFVASPAHAGIVFTGNKTGSECPSFTDRCP
jgi:hypothetical protein